MRPRLRSQEGVALTVAIFTMAVIALFSALVASTAVNVGDTSNRDRDSKRALGAAEAGINTALHRLNGLTSALDNLGCLTDVQLGVLAQATPYPGIKVTGGGNLVVQQGSCPGATGRAGNGGTWTYYITLLNNGQNCDAQYTTQTQVNNLLSVSIGGISVLRRCITSFGVVNGAQRRLQREIYSEFRLFYGLTATGQIWARGTSGLTPGVNLGTTHVGSNALVRMDSGSTFAGQVELQQEAPAEQINATGQWGVTRRPEPWILDPVDVPSSLSTPGGISCVGPLLDLTCGSSTAGLDSLRLRVPAGYTVTIAQGEYRLCEFSVSGGTVLVTGTAKIFLDEDCTGGGAFSFSGGLLNATGLAVSQNLQVYAESDDPITITGGTVAQANLALYAPESVVTVNNTGLLKPTVKGSISASQIDLMAGTTFIGDPLLDITTPFAQIAGKWHPGRWSECPAYPPAGGNEQDGCNG